MRACFEFDTPLMTTQVHRFPVVTASKGPMSPVGRSIFQAHCSYILRSPLTKPRLAMPIPIMGNCGLVSVQHYRTKDESSSSTGKYDAGYAATMLMRRGQFRTSSNCQVSHHVILDFMSPRDQDKGRCTSLTPLAAHHHRPRTSGTFDVPGPFSTIPEPPLLSTMNGGVHCQHL